MYIMNVIFTIIINSSSSMYFTASVVCCVQFEDTSYSALKVCRQTSVQLSMHMNMPCWHVILACVTWWAVTPSSWRFSLSCQSSLVIGYLQKGYSCQVFSTISINVDVSVLMSVFPFLYRDHSKHLIYCLLPQALPFPKIT